MDYQQGDSFIDMPVTRRKTSRTRKAGGDTVVEKKDPRSPEALLGWTDLARLQSTRAKLAEKLTNKEPKPDPSEMTPAALFLHQLGLVSKSPDYQTVSNTSGIHPQQEATAVAESKVTSPQTSCASLVPVKLATVSDANVASISRCGGVTQKAFKIKDKIYIVFPSANQTITLPIPSKRTTSTEARNDVVHCPSATKSVEYTPAPKVPAVIPRTSDSLSIQKLSGQRLIVKMGTGASSAAVGQMPRLDIKPDVSDEALKSDVSSFVPQRILLSGSHADGSLLSQNFDSEPISYPDGDECLVKLSLALQIDNDKFSKSAEPLYRDMVVTVVTASRHHPLHGRCQYSTDVTATYNSQGCLMVVQTPYIEDGIYELVPDYHNSKTPHPDFPKAYIQKSTFIWRSTTDDMAPGSQYVILGDICPVPSTLSKTNDLLTNKFVEFLSTPDFLTYTLPILLGHGEKDIWSRQLRRSQTNRVVPVFLQGKVDNEKWKWLETAKFPQPRQDTSWVNQLSKTLDFDCIPGDAPFCDYVYGRYVIGAVVEAERDRLLFEHTKKCWGYECCMEPDEYKAFMKQHVNRNKRSTHVGTRKRKRSRSKSVTPAKRTKSSVVNKKSSVSPGVSSTTTSDSSAISDWVSPTSSQSEDPLQAPLSAGRPKRSRKRKAVCDCPDCISVIPPPKKVHFVDTDAGGDPLTGADMEVRSF